jgi:AcrR family transcriptional regulator
MKHPRGRTGRRANPPRGRQQVRAALLRAAAELFAARGPAAVSIRDVAARAKVNHGLVHRHFGSKRALLREVLAQHVRAMAAVIADREWTPETQAQLVQSLFVHRDYWRVLARTLLDGMKPATVQREHPVIRRMVDAYRDMQERGELSAVFDARLVAAGTAAQYLGWVLFEPFLVQAAELGDRPLDETRQRFFDATLEVLRRMG